MSSIFDQASLIWDGRLRGSAAGKLFPLKPNVKDLTGDFITVTRASTKLRIGSNGLYGSVANNVPAFEFNTDGTYRGLLVEPGATNSIRNNSMTGAVAGTPGTLPTNWGEALSGLTREVVGTGTENGVTYIDIKLSGTAAATLAELRFETATSIVASTGQSWTNSFFAKSISAPNPPVRYEISIVERTAGGSFVASGNLQFVPTSTIQRFSQTRTLSGGGTVERVQPLLVFVLVNGATYDFTIRIGWPQMETGSVATSPIVTTAGTASRVADVVSLTGASSLIGQTEGTIYMELDVRNFLPASAIYAIALTDGTTNNIIGLRRVGTTGLLNFAIVQGGVFGASISLSPISNGVVKIAGGYANNDAVFYVNGVQVGTDTSVTIPSTSRIDLGGITGASQIADYIRSVAVFPTRLANATLQALTA